MIRRSGVRDEERIELVRRALERADCDALVCARPTNVRMLTGYWPVVGTSLAVFTREAIRLIVPDDECDLARDSWADAVMTFSPASLDAITSVRTAVAPAVADTLRSLGLKATVSIACDAGGAPEPVSYVGMYHYGAALPQVVTAAMPQARVVVDVTLLPRLRAVLTRRELGVLRDACAAAARAFESAAARITSGMPETAVADLVRSGLSEAALTNTRRAGGFVFCMAGARAAQAWAAYQVSTPAPIRSGDTVLVHCNSYLDGLWTDVTRTYVASSMSARHQRMFDAVLEARSAALSAVRPGATGRDVDAAARQVIERHGFGKHYRHATGHGVGFAAIDHDAQPRLHPASSDVLEDGMVFNVEPAVYLEGEGGIRHCDVVALAGGRPEVLTPFQSSPLVISR